MIKVTSPLGGGGASSSHRRVVQTIADMRDAYAHTDLHKNTQCVDAARSGWGGRGINVAMAKFHRVTWKEQRKETKFTNAEKMLIFFCYALHKYLTSTWRMAQYTVLGEPLQTRTPPLIRWAYILSAIHTHRVELYSAYNIYIVCFCHMILWGGDFILCTNIQRNDGTFVLYAQVYQTR